MLEVALIKHLNYSANIIRVVYDAYRLPDLERKVIWDSGLKPKSVTVLKQLFWPFVAVVYIHTFNIKFRIIIYNRSVLDADGSRGKCAQLNRRNM